MNSHDLMLTENQKQQVAEKFLGDTLPKDFETEGSIYQYFDEESLTEMFPNEDIDPCEVEIALSWTLLEWLNVQY